MKLKEFGPPGGGARPLRPLRSATGFTVTNLVVERGNRLKLVWSLQISDGFEIGITDQIGEIVLNFELL